MRARLLEELVPSNNNCREHSIAQGGIRESSTAADPKTAVQDQS